MCGSTFGFLRQQIVGFFSHKVQAIVNRIMTTLASAPAHEIVSGLWLGNKAASNEDWLTAHQIDAVFNCTKDLPFAQTVPRHLYRVPVDDNLQEDEIRNLEHWSWEIMYKLRKEHASGKRILVHCFAGMQRSAAVTAMYLIATYRCTTDEAIAFIKSRRPVAFMGSVNFYQAIKRFEESYRQMIAKQNAYSSYPRIPLPTDQVTNT
jgi:protein-tyrosine phosphatase